MYRRLHEGELHVQADINTRSIDGENWWWERILYTLEYDSDGNPCRAVVVGEDISKEKENEIKYETEARKRLELSIEVQYREQLFDALSYNVDNIYIILGGEKQEFLQYLSPNLERILGIKPEMISDSLDSLSACILREEEAKRWRSDLTWEEENPFCSGICFKNAHTGQFRWMETEIRRLNMNGTSGLLLMLNNMTEAKNHEKQLAKSSLIHPGALTIPIYAMTADAFAQDIEREKASGMNGHFAKPLDIAAVCREISKIF